MADSSPSGDRISDRRRRLRAAMDQRTALLVPGAANALTARVIQDVGFDAVYVTGAGIANTLLGVPDIGLVTLTELVHTTEAIAEICDLPLIVDIDTGFGNAVNTRRTVRVLERAGACALHKEDQVFPKKCGHFDGKGVIPAGEMVAKIQAAVDASEDHNLLIVARTDARAVEGFEASLERAERYIEAGADMTFVEAPTSEQEMRAITQRLSVPQVANMVVGGRTPLQAAMRAMSEVLGALHRDGGLYAVKDRLAGFEERQRLVDKASYDALEKLYAVE